MKPVFVLLLFGLTSCNTAMRIAMGIKQPKIETNKSLAKFLQTSGVNDTLLLHIDSVSSYSLKDQINDLSRLPALELYSPDGHLTGSLEGDECSNIERKIKDFSFENTSDTSGKRLADVLQLYETGTGNKINMDYFSGCQGIVCIYYIKALGRVSKDALSGWPEFMKMHEKYPGLKILYLNIDMHETWGIRSRKDDRYLVFDF